MNKDIPKGSKVLLSPQFDDCRHTPFNPLSTFGIMQGENKDEHGWYVVKWDNGQSNQYQADGNELVVVSVPMLKRSRTWICSLVALAALAASVMLGHQETKRMLADDCAKLNQTYIDGQMYICKPYNPKAKRVK